MISRNIYFIKIAVLTCLSAIFNYASAQALAERPQYKVSDSWTFEHRDGYTGNVTGKSTRTIKSISDDKIEYDINGDPATSDISGNPISDKKVDSDKPQLYLQFPLEVGKSWKFDNGWHNKEGGWKGNQTYSVKVVSLEKITVPAGEFETYRLEAKGFFNNTTANFSGAQTTIYWYSPLLRRVIKTEYKGANNKNMTQLIEYKLAD